MSVAQEGFRWRNDDGSETSATWLAAQDTNVSLELDETVRLRMLLNATGNPAASPYTLCYKKSTDSTWLPVPVGAGGAVQSVRFNTNGQRYTCSASTHHATTFTWCCWIKKKVDTGTWGPFISVDPGGGTYNALAWGGSGDELVRYANGADVSSGYTPPIDVWTFVASTQISTPQTKMYWQAEGVHSSMQSTTSAVAASVSGTFAIGKDGYNNSVDASLSSVKVWSGAVLSQSELEAERLSVVPVRTSNLWAYWSFENGPQTNDESGNGHTLTTVGTPILDTTGPPGLTGSSSPNPVYIAASSNITAGGQVTTAQLSAPSGKTTSDFITGRMWDNENGTDLVNI